MDDFGKHAGALKAVTGRQFYFLEVLGEEKIHDISVVSFRIVETMGQPYRIDIVATHPQKLKRDVVLGHEASFKMVPQDGIESRVFWGRITRFTHTKTTKDQSHYEIVVEPHIACLTPRNTQTYQQQSAPGDVMVSGDDIDHSIFQKAASFEKGGPGAAMQKASLPYTTDLPDTGGHGSRFSG